MLAAYASLVQRLGPGAIVYGGTYEWSSWRVASMQATAFGYGFVEARGRARFAWRKCVTSVSQMDKVLASASPSGYTPFLNENNGTAPDSGGGASGAPACVGPIAFAKGPFMMFNRKAVRCRHAKHAMQRATVGNLSL